MKALIQRVRHGAVSVDDEIIAEIGNGYVILLGVGKEDNETDVAYLVKKTLSLRILPDEGDKLNLSLLDTKGEALVVSQFTLYADTTRGNRPGFEPAAPPDLANKLYEEYVSGLRDAGVTVFTGVFGAHMQVEILNDGPVTIILESPAKGAKK